MRNTHFILVFSFLNFINSLHAKEDFNPETVKISKKIITINKEALRAPASSQEPTAGEETLSEAMEKVEEPKLWFNP